VVRLRDRRLVPRRLELLALDLLANQERRSGRGAVGAELRATRLRRAAHERYRAPRTIVPVSAAAASEEQGRRTAVRREQHKAKAERPWWEKAEDERGVAAARLCGRWWRCAVPTAKRYTPSCGRYLYEQYLMRNLL